MKENNYRGEEVKTAEQYMDALSHCVKKLSFGEQIEQYEAATFFSQIFGVLDEKELGKLNRMCLQRISALEENLFERWGC